MQPDKIKNNPLLDFKTELNENTGVLGKSYAYYRGLKFNVFPPTIANSSGRITMEGSLHKYFNGGKHNYNDFDVSDVIGVFDEIDKLFGIQSKDCVLKQLELGVNINPPRLSKLVIRSCYLHGTKRFGWQSTRDEGSYIQSDCSRKTIKIYDKAQHYRNKGFKIPDEILRVEVKFKKMEYLNSLNIYTLSDLIDIDLNSFVKTTLIKEWKRVLFCDEDIIKQNRLSNNYNNPNYWLTLAESNYELFKYHRGNLNKVYQEKPQNMKTLIKDLIHHKTDNLKLKTT